MVMTMVPMMVIGGGYCGVGNDVGFGVGGR